MLAHGCLEAVAELHHRGRLLSSRVEDRLGGHPGARHAVGPDHTERLDDLGVQAFGGWA